MDELDYEMKLLFLPLSLSLSLSLSLPYSLLSSEIAESSENSTSMQFSWEIGKNDELRRIFGGAFASSQTSKIFLIFLQHLIPVSQRKFKLEILLHSHSTLCTLFFSFFSPSWSRTRQKQPAENSNFLIYLISGCFGFGAHSKTAF